MQIRQLALGLWVISLHLCLKKLALLDMFSVVQFVGFVLIHKQSTLVEIYGLKTTKLKCCIIVPDFFSIVNKLSLIYFISVGGRHLLWWDPIYFSNLSWVVETNRFMPYQWFPTATPGFACVFDDSSLKSYLYQTNRTISLMSNIRIYVQ